MQQQCNNIKYDKWLSLDATNFWVFNFPLLGFHEQDIKYTVDTQKFMVNIICKRTENPTTHMVQPEVNTWVQLPHNILMPQLKIRWFINGLIFKAPYTNQAALVSREMLKQWPQMPVTREAFLEEASRGWKSNRARLSIENVPKEVEVLMQWIDEARRCRTFLPTWIELVRNPITQRLQLEINLKTRAFLAEEMKVTMKKTLHTLIIEGRHEVKCYQEQQNEKTPVVFQEFTQLHEEFVFPQFQQKDVLFLEEVQTKMLPNNVFRINIPCRINPEQERELIEGKIISVKQQ